MQAGPSVTVVGGGVAGLSAACALAEVGLTVRLLERRPYLGGRAYSFRHPGSGELIDNCQHVVFGCCTNVMGFYRRAGVDRQIAWTDRITMIEPGGRRSVLGSGRLPAPLHGMPRFLAASAFDWRDKLALARGLGAMMRGVPSGTSETLAQWLRRHRQTPRAIERFWRLVIASALNAEPENIGADYAAMVIRELFVRSPEAGRMGMSRVPLGELYRGVQEFLKGKGAMVQLNTAVEGAEWDHLKQKWIVRLAGRASGSGGPPLQRDEKSGGDAASTVLRGETVTSDFLVLALPFEALGKLLPHLPPGGEPLAAQISRHEHWPILSVHLWFDRIITDLEHAVLLEGEFHWLYHKTRLQPGRPQDRSYVELVVSAARSFSAVPAEEIVARALRALPRYFPAAAAAKLLDSSVVKEQKATFGVPPEIDSARPPAAAPWPNAFLAGDWIRTGWPSTMESAARSGHLAAEAVLRKTGNVKKLLEQDLPSRGLLIFRTR
ncbi:MAG TPA: hydroxysqualene dehydroxylase HpnE [Opitutaceae bacterium]